AALAGAGRCRGQQGRSRPRFGVGAQHPGEQIKEVRHSLTAQGRAVKSQRKAAMKRAVWSSRLLTGLVVFAIFTVIALVDINQTYFLITYTNPSLGLPPHITVGNLVGRGLAEWYLWAMMTPMLVWVGRHFPLDDRAWKRNLLSQGVLCAVISCFK